MLSVLKKPDKNPFIAKKQAALRKSLTSWKKGTALQDAIELAWYFYAAGNAKVARSIVDEIVDNVADTDNFNVAHALQGAICAAARFAREAKDKTREKQLIARAVRNPEFSDDRAGRGFFREEIARNKEQLVHAPNEKRAETGCVYAANSLARFVYFAEMVRAGAIPTKWVARGELESMIDEAFEVIATRIPK